MEKMPKMKTRRSRQSERRVDAEVDAVRPSGETFPGLPGQGMHRGRWHAPCCQYRMFKGECTTRHRCLRTSREGLHGGRKSRRTAGYKMLMQPSIGGIDERDGD
jgi:hypothetical protein